MDNFNIQTHRQIPYATDVMGALNKGALMKMVLDYEATGTGASDAPYVTPNTPHLTEFGAVVKDFAGNLTGQVLDLKIQLPQDVLIEPEAAILTRQSPSDLRRADRIHPRKAAAMIAWFSEQAKFDYASIAKRFGDDLKTHPILDIKRQFEPKELTESYYVIPMKDDHGQLIELARYYPNIKKLALRIDNESLADSPFWGDDNNYFKDLNDHTLWRWQDLALTTVSYNGSSYDLPVERMNLYRQGYEAQNAAFRTARATITNKQTRKNYHRDLLPLAIMVSAFGPQDDKGLKLHDYIDEHTGSPKLSAKLGDVIRANEQSRNMSLFTGQGIRQFDNSLFDDLQAHGALYDTLATSALEDYCQSVAPWLMEQMNAQNDRDQLIDLFMRQNTDGSHFPIVLTAEKQGQHVTITPLYFLGTDDHVGRFNQLLFLRLDMDLTAQKLEKFTADDWAERLQKNKAFSPVKSINFNKRPGFLRLDDAVKHSALPQHVTKSIPRMIENMQYILQNPHIQNTVMDALSAINHDRRFNSYRPAVPLLEDDFLSQMSGNVHFQQDYQTISKRKSAVNKGAQTVEDIVLLNRQIMQDTFDFTRAIDRAGRLLFIQPHMIEHFEGIDPNDAIHEQRDDLGQLTPEGEFAARVFENYVDLCNRSMQVYANKQAHNYVKILQSFKKPDGSPYFDGKKFTAQTVGEALNFRQQLLKRAANDIIRARNSDAPALKAFTQGIVSKNFCHQMDGNDPLFLFADADNGDAVSPPFIGDQIGREIPLATMKYLQNGQGNPHVLYKNLVDDRTWGAYFYRLRSSPTSQRIARELDRQNLLDDVDSYWDKYLQSIRQHSLYTPPNQQPNEASSPRVENIQLSLDRLKIGSHAHLPYLEHPQRNAPSAAASTLIHHESPAILADAQADLNKTKKQFPKHISHQFDPKSGLPYLYIPQTITRDGDQHNLTKDPNLVVFDVPLRHLFNPAAAQHPQLHFNGLVLPNIPKTKLKALDKGKDIVVRCRETGQLFATGKSSITHLSPQLQAENSNLIHTARQLYADSHMPLKPDADLFYLGTEYLEPIGNTNPSVSHEHAGLILPTQQFYALTAPQYANMGTQKLGAVIMPARYISDGCKTNQPLNLYEGQGDPYSHFDGKAMNRTGHMYQTKITELYGIDKKGHVHGMPMKTLREDFEAGRIDPKIFTEAGYLNAEDFFAKAKKWSAIKQHKDSEGSDMAIIRFAPVNDDYQANKHSDERQNQWSMHFNQGTQPKAAFQWDSAPISPLAFGLK